MVRHFFDQPPLSPYPTSVLKAACQTLGTPSLHISDIYWVPWERSNPALFVGNFTRLFTGSYFAYFWQWLGLVRNPTQPCLLAILPGSLKSSDIVPPKRKSKVKTCHRFTIIFRWVNSAVWLSAPGIIFSVIFSLPNYFMVYFLSLG